jgi:hypothetical protein
LEAFFIAIGIWFLLGLTSHTVIVGIPSWHSWGEPAGPHEIDGRSVECGIPWVERTTPPFPPDPVGYPPYRASISLKLPVTSPHLYFHSRGTYGGGVIRFLADDSLVGSEDVSVEIDVRYWSLRTRDAANVCLLENDGGGKGIGIFTPIRRWPGAGDELNRLRFVVTVRFPASSRQPLALNTVSSALPLFRQELGDLSIIDFRSLTLQGSNAGISARSVSAHFIDLKTSNGAITGRFNTTDRVVLQTSNGFIDTDLDLLNEDHDHGKATAAVLQTSNARIVSRNSLISTSGSKKLPSGGRFDIKARTSNGRTEISFPTSPHTSVLNLEARTSNAATDVSLHPAYEGSISLRTSNAAPTIEDAKVEDPSGRGRKREINIKRLVRGALDATVAWGRSQGHENPTEPGVVSVTTSNGRNVVKLL